MVPKHSTCVDVSDQGGVVHRGEVLDSHQVRLGHHRVASIGVQADVRANVAAECAEVPHEVLRALDHVQNAGLAALSAADFLQGEIHLPALAVRRLVPGILALLALAQQHPFTCTVRKIQTSPISVLQIEHKYQLSE